MIRYLIAVNGTYIKRYSNIEVAKRNFIKIVENSINKENQMVLLIDKLMDYRSICEFYNLNIRDYGGQYR